MACLLCGASEQRRVSRKELPRCALGRANHREGHQGQTGCSRMEKEASCASPPPTRKPFLTAKLPCHFKSRSQGVQRLLCSAPSPSRWLLYPKPFFEDTPYILEPGEHPTLEAWGTSGPIVGSLKTMRLVRSWGRGRGRTDTGHSVPSPQMRGSLPQSSCWELD